MTDGTQLKRNPDAPPVDRQNLEMLERRIIALKSMISKTYSSDFVIDENSSKIMLVKYSETSTIANIFIKGALFPVTFYTELGLHDHDTTIPTLTHKHWFEDDYAYADHKHPISSDGNDIADVTSHNHGGETNNGGADTISISGNTENPSNTTAASSTTAGVNGGTISGAVKTYVDGMQILVNGVDRTLDILAATGWAKIGDGLSTHVFVTSGSGEVDLSRAMTTGINTIEFKEPTAGKGGRVLVHVEVS